MGIISKQKWLRGHFNSFVIIDQIINSHKDLRIAANLFLNERMFTEKRHLSREPYLIPVQELLLDEI